MHPLNLYANDICWWHFWHIKLKLPTDLRLQILSYFFPALLPLFCLEQIDFHSFSSENISENIIFYYNKPFTTSMMFNLSFVKTDIWITWQFPNFVLFTRVVLFPFDERCQWKQFISIFPSMRMNRIIWIIIPFIGHFFRNGL